MFTTYQLLVIIPVLLLLARSWSVNSDLFARPELVAWILIVSAVELLPVAAWRDLHVSLGFPLLMAVAFLEAPPAAAAVALFGAIDPRELKREVSLLRAIFNRTQIACSVWIASLVFHATGSIEASPLGLIASALSAVVADYMVNMTLVTGAGVILYRLPPFQMMHRMRIGRLSEFLISYLGLGLLGVILALLHVKVGFWSVATFLAPLVLARQMFFRSRALEEAHEELKEREHVLRALSNRMAEERQDERAHIAAYLHDDLAQLLFRLSLQVDIAKRHLQMDEVDATERDLEAIRETKNRTSEKIRALIRDLHRSPLGRAGLAEAIESFVEDVGRGLDTEFHTEVADLALPPPIQLLAYHIVREAVMNSLRHAAARQVWISLQPGDGCLELVVRDDGIGFDVEQPRPEGHFGLAMMRERAQVAGGTYSVQSAPGAGTTVTVRFPTSWLQEDWEAEALPEPQAVPSATATEVVPA